MNFTRLFDILPYQAMRFPQPIAMAEHLDGQWHSYSSQGCIENINATSAGLLELGLQPGDTFGLIAAAGSPSWSFMDFGAQQIGVVPVPIHFSITDEDLIFIINDSTIQYCIVPDDVYRERLLDRQNQMPSLKQIFTFQKGPFYWKNIQQSEDQNKLAAIKKKISEDQLATIIYTSGTTGLPKGVMLSHKNIVSNIKSILPLIPINQQCRTLSFLPVSHVFERMVIYSYLAVGASVYFSSSIEDIADDLKTVKPHYFSSVPRLLEKTYGKIMAESRRRGKRYGNIVRWAIQLGERFDGKKNHSLGYRIKVKIADLLVFWHWRQRMGGQVRGIIVGAAALAPRLGRLFSAAGIHIREGYGLTETSPVITFNRFEPGGSRFGTVGLPIPGMELKIIAPDSVTGAGQIIVKGPNVMMGYYKQPELTKAVLDENGWFKTGDVGRMIEKRFLQITDRHKDIFKTSSGKYIAPQRLENLLTANPYIDQAMIIGFQRPYVIALIIPDFAHLKNWCADNKIHWTSPQFMIINHKVVQFIKIQVELINKQLSGHEIIRDFILDFTSWSIEEGQVTPTLKLKRKVIEEQFAKAIETMYQKQL